MRYGCAALLMLISFAVTASAQVDVHVTAPAPIVDGVTSHALMINKLDVRVSPEQVVARLMSFDGNRDGKVATNELSERMQGLVARGDRGGDGALDAEEIRSLTQSPQFATAASRNQFGGYSFGDSVGLSSRTHIENTIEDLRLAPQTNEQARRMASAFSDELEGVALSNLRQAIAPMLTETQLAEFETGIKRGGTRTISMVSNNGTRTTQTFAIGTDPGMLLGRHQLTPEQRRKATTAVETFKTEQKLDEFRRSALVSQLSGILTDEERDNFSAALARRPLVKGGAGFAGFTVGSALQMTNQLRNAVLITSTPVSR